MGEKSLKARSDPTVIFNKIIKGLSAISIVARNLAETLKELMKSNN